MRNKKTIKEFRAFYIMASSVYAKSSRKRKSGVIVQFNKKHGRLIKNTPKNKCSHGTTNYIAIVLNIKCGATV